MSYPMVFRFSSLGPLFLFLPPCLYSITLRIPFTEKVEQARDKKAIYAMGQQKSVGVRRSFELIDFSDGEPRDAGNQVGG